MKRGKDDDKIMGPMFPRLHVNDTDKGGPRAPPRNKMALYEQLSIPSQRFNHGTLPRSQSNASNLAPPGSSSQGNSLERKFPYSHYVPSPTPTPVADKYHLGRPDGGNSNASAAQLLQRKKVGNEDDFTVPVFVHSRKGQNHTKTQTGTDQEKLVPPSPTYLGHPLKVQNVGVDDPKHVGSTGLNPRQNAINQPKEDLEVHLSSSDHVSKDSTIMRNREMIARPDEANASQNQHHRDDPASNLTRLCENDDCLQQKSSARFQSHSSGCCVPELRAETEKRNISGNNFCLRKNSSSPIEPEIDCECLGDTPCGSLQLRNGDGSNDASETSMVDSISALDISPDDVVGVIGQKHFWKARRAIVNQQRVFAVQVFELHRLIKVQQLIAQSPHLLLEDVARLAKSPTKGSPSENLPSECVVTPPVHVVKRKDDSGNPNNNMECSAENTIGKTSFSSVKNGQPPNYAGAVRVPMATDTNMGPLFFHPSAGHQWLVPVMSATEGLVYKPYTTPGFMGSGCGGCGPFAPVPLTGMPVTSSAYGVPTSHYHQGIGFLPCAPPVGNGYFPPYGMPVMNPAIPGSVMEQKNYFTGSGSHGHTAQFPGGVLNPNMQHQSSCNQPTQKSEAGSQGMKHQASKDTELQGSTGSSPIGRMPQAGTAQATDGRDTLLPFPMAPPGPEGAPQPQETDQPSRVIRVVPHNARSASESAARIFQSLQEGRKQ